MNKYKERTITCKNCGKVVTKRTKKDTKYCSHKCYATMKKPERKKGEIKKCGSCNKEIYITKSASRKINFCSVKCFNNFQSKKIEHKCIICGKKFYWSPGREKNLNRPIKYCSIQCRNKCEKWKEGSAIKGNLIQNKKKGLNKLEIEGSKILNDLGIKHETQSLICNKFCVDVLIPDKKIVIQWDGDYWHGYNEIKSERQKKRVQLDRSQDEYMKKAGYKVIRFWEHELKKEKEKVIEYIKKAI